MDSAFITVCILIFKVYTHSWHALHYFGCSALQPVTVCEKWFTGTPRPATGVSCLSQSNWILYKHYMLYAGGLLFNEKGVFKVKCWPTFKQQQWFGWSICIRVAKCFHVLLSIHSIILSSPFSTHVSSSAKPVCSLLHSRLHPLPVQPSLFFLSLSSRQAGCAALLVFRTFNQ